MKRLVIGVWVAGALISGWPAASGQAAMTMEQLEAQIKVLQQQVAELQAAQQAAAQAPRETASAPPPSQFPQPYSAIAERSEGEGPVGRYFKKLAGATVGGYITEELENFDGNTRTFDNQRFVLFVGREITDRLRFYSEIEFEHLSSIASTAADSRGGEIDLEQAWFDYGINDLVNIRFGNVLVPFGRFNLTHDDPLQELTDRPLVARRVIPTTWTESGLGVYGDWQPGGDWHVTYETYVVNGLNHRMSATSGGLRDARGSAGSDNNHDKALVGRVTVSPLPAVEVGVAGYTGEYDRQGHRANGAAVDWRAQHGPFEVVGEAALFDLARGVNASGSVVPDRLWGAYVEGRYRFWPRWLDGTFLARGFDEPRFTATLRYDHAAISRFAGAGDFGEDRITFGLNYRPADIFVVKLDYEINNGTIERGHANGFIASAALSF